MLLIMYYLIDRGIYVFVKNHLLYTYKRRQQIGEGLGFVFEWQIVL